MPTPSPTLIAAGPWQDAEFTNVRTELDPDQHWQMLPTLRAAIDHIAAASDPPELVLLAQARPGCDDQTAIERLRLLAPLTPVIVVAGSWCEGELRTGRPLTGVVRLYWYEFAAWWRAALQRIANGGTPPWAEPLTDPRAGQAVRLGATTNGGSLVHHAERVVAIDATDYSTFEALSAGLAGLGWRCVWQPRHRPVLHAAANTAPHILTAGIWNGGQLDAEELPNLATFCRRLRAHNAPVVALLDFPRVEYLEQAESAGAAALLAKPYQFALLHNELTRVSLREEH